ncbi:MAG: acyl-CoA synthetase [Cytophagaceae bacterium]|jgi:O-succinylbenzoic acid--CoA ligase|nr:acyl-CoA synthetase [Cytophagaceae bacterium]
MLQLSFNSIPADLSGLKDDENLRPAIDFINEWYAGAESFTFYSSGSTGVPKPTVLSKTFLIASAKRTIDLFNINSSDCLLLALNTSFMGGMMMVVRALVAECTLIYLSPSNLSADALTALPHIKLASLVPSQIQGLLHNNTLGDPFLQIDNLLMGGAPLNSWLENRLQNLHSACLFFHTYGMTETASHVAIRALHTKETLYHALNGYEFSQDHRDCLIIHHLNPPAFTLVTQDVVKLMTPLTFEWTGRVDWVINSGGIKYSLEKAEECVTDFFYRNNIQNSFTSYKLPDETWGEKWALVVTGVLDQNEIDQLTDYCKVTLGKYIYPKEILFAKKIVYLPSGKVDRLNSYLEAIKLSS